MLLSDCCETTIVRLLWDCYCQYAIVRLLLSVFSCQTATVRLPLSVEWKKLTAECFDLSVCCDHLQSCWLQGTWSFLRSRSFSVQLVNKFPHFMELERSSPCSQQRPIFPHPEPNQSNRLTSYTFNIHLDILPSVSSFSKWAVSFRFFFTKILYAFLFSVMCAAFAVHPIHLDLIAQVMIG